MHHLNLKRKGKTNFMSFKLDMSKIYDRVQWHFLEAMIIKLDFGKNWIKLVMLYVKLAKYSIMINREQKECVKPSWGLWGNPLLPYIFFICTEDLISLLSEATSDCNLTSIWIFREEPTINHLLFVDDSIIFYKADMQENKPFLIYWSYMKKLRDNKSTKSKLHSRST